MTRGAAFFTQPSRKAVQFRSQVKMRRRRWLNNYESKEGPGTKEGFQVQIERPSWLQSKGGQEKPRKRPDPGMPWAPKHLLCSPFRLWCTMVQGKNTVTTVTTQLLGARSLPTMWSFGMVKLLPEPQEMVSPEMVTRTRMGCCDGEKNRLLV